MSLLLALADGIGPTFRCRSGGPRPIQDKPIYSRRDWGVCVAQHIGRALWGNGCSYYVVESAPDSLPASERRDWNYGVFSARYGNLYTARQLLQLFDRAYSIYNPQLTVWQT